jgi:CRP-like cAMP-binding protein
MERIFACVCMLFNMFLLAYIVGTVSSIATKADETTAVYRDRLLELKRYASRNNLPQSLIDTMRRCIDLEHAQASSGAASGAFEASFPNFVTSRARNLRHRPLLSKVDLFTNGKADISNSEFLTALTARANEETLMDGLRVFEANDVAQETYVLAHGSAVILIPDDNGIEQVVHTYGPGEVLGAESFFTGLALPWAVLIVGFTRALKLAEQDKTKLFEAFPEDRHNVGRNLATIITDMGKSASLHLLWTTAEGGQLQALRRWGRICQSTMHGLAAQRAREEQRLTEMLCKLAANNLVAELQHLLQTEEIPNSTDYDGRAAMHLAAAHGNSDVIELLVGEGADIDIPDRFGRTPLFQACTNRHPESVEKIRKLGGNLNLRDPGGEMCRVATVGDSQLLELLLKAGADPTAGDYDSRTAMHLSTSDGNVTTTRLLLKHASETNQLDATINAKDRWGKTPVDGARAAGNSQMIELLAEYAVDRRSHDGS